MFLINIIIKNVDGKPIYEQIYNQIKAQIISGAVSEGESLPSIRFLAKELKISVITTKRAYDELEKDGYIYTIAGKGSFVAEKNLEIIREEYLKQIEKHISSIISLAETCRLSKKEVLELINIMFTED